MEMGLGEVSDDILKLMCWEDVKTMQYWREWNHYKDKNHLNIVKNPCSSYVI